MASDWLLLTAEVGVGDLGLAAVAQLTSLKELHLDNRLFSDLGLRTIAPLTNLETLDLFGARISDAGCVHLRSCSPGIHSHCVVACLGFCMERLTCSSFQMCTGIRALI